MDPSRFVAELEGLPVELVALRGDGIEAWITTYGAIVCALRTPAVDGSMADVVLGCDSLDAYRAGHPYFGALCGRYANRIARARFALDGEVHQLAANNGVNHLHGGEVGFDKRNWRILDRGPAHLDLQLLSGDGDEGYPGTLSVTVRYELRGGALAIAMQATSDAATVVNLTHHGYFNLAGHGAGSVLDHELQSPAETMLATDTGSIPLPGAPLPVAGTPFDFRSTKPLGAEIGADDQQLRLAGGYDHHLIVPGSGLRHAATLRHPGSGRRLELWSDDAGFQLYTGNFLDGTVIGKEGVTYAKHGGVCLEPQSHPDSPNRADFPDVVLRPGMTYSRRAEYRFSAA